jgi:ribonucleoside-diphosphate reductase alpha chain
MAMAPEQMGIGIRRHFTEPGAHPYETLEWERRDARIPNYKNGTDAFFQPDVEFPVNWSQNATNIVAQKYFRGTLGAPERESSLRQVIDRIADTIADWGIRDGYFADDDEAETFRDELKYVLVHQRAAFNSPVWFNIGVRGVPQQASACQPYDAPVSTPEGTVSIGKLVEHHAVGTKVFDAFGLTKIVAVKHNGRKDVLRIHTCTGVTLDVTADHLVWCAVDEVDGGFVEAGSLRAGDNLERHADDSLELLRIDRIEPLGEMDVYDIQTDSGEYLSNDIRVHNCFILAVEDTMDAILNWYREEGIIFKGGSGSGINLSGLRSSQEGLQGGGTASGPVSFMRGADASAGTIKSGGKTRRAAKMVILNADHPDIEEFIWCKAIEERKARALGEAGFDMDLDGKDSHSIQYQNANNSVRVTDEFMQAVLDDRDWQLKSVTTGEVAKTMKARELMRQISEATWECADPGMQFDSTINHWHTAPNTGRINASNPCSEYMHLDNSACNLASINLLKYLNDDDEFDVEGFERTVEVMFTAQEILVGNADYPTEKIAETSRAFRQLGLGYANLGALLMARGLPYDSPEGRAWAGAITSLMTGHAYATSARTAARMGPFSGFADNADPMLSVLRMHREEAAKIADELVDRELLSAARRAWDEATSLGEKHGVRNSQASVLAPTGTIALALDCDTTGIEPDLALTKAKKLVGGGTMLIVNQTVPRALRRLGYAEDQIDQIVAYINEHKSIVGAPGLNLEHLPVFACSMGDNTIHYMGHVTMMGAVQPFISGAISKCVVGSTLLTTADGLVRIGDLHRGEAPDSFRSEIIELASLDGSQKSDAFYYGGVKRVREIVLRSGHRIIGTPNHRVLVAGAGRLEWIPLEDVLPDEFVAVQYGDDLWSTTPARFDDFQPSAPYGSQTRVKAPGEMTEELGFLLGAYVAEGHTTRSNYSVRITNAVESVLERVARAWQELFGIEARIVHPQERCPEVVVASKTVVEFLEYLGCGHRASLKRIPDAVLRSPREVVLAFLQGLALDAYVTTSSMPQWAICVDSWGLLDDLQTVLTNLGVIHSRISKLNKANGKIYDEVYATGEQAQRVVELVPFLEPDKAARASGLTKVVYSGSHRTSDVVPSISPRELYELIPKGRSGRNGAGTGRSTEFGFLCDERTRHVTRRALERVAAIPGVVLPEWLQTVLRDNLHFSPVTAATNIGWHEVFDVSVPATQAFVGNGIVNHNTVNMPEDVSVEDVEQLHIDAWKLGLKAIAIYRDNCKVAQPLATQKKETKSETVTVSEGDGEPLVREVERVVEHVITVKEPVRQKLPKRRISKTFSFRVADCHGYVTVGEFEDGRPGELFLKVAKQGSTLAGIMDGFAIAVSLGLQFGVPLRTFVEKFTNVRFEPAGMTDDREIRFATSLLDFIFRRLAVEYLPADERREIGVLTVDERLQPTLPGVEEASTESHAGLDTLPVEEQAPEAVQPSEAASTMSSTIEGETVICHICGDIMQRAGTCYACPSCGTTSGCS